MMYYIWLNEINELVSTLKPYLTSELNEIMKEKGQKGMDGKIKVSIAIGEKEYLRQTYFQTHNGN